MTDPGELAQQLAALESRVDRLERRLASPAPAPVPVPVPVPGVHGEIGYHGSVDLTGSVEWTVSYDAAATLGLPARRVAELLAALGHPVRLELVRTLLLRGESSAAELVEATGMSSTGQLYHHLRALTNARLVEQSDGRTYRVHGRKVVPILVLVLAAADAGEALAAG